jgi:hypothetical protein
MLKTARSYRGEGRYTVQGAEKNTSNSRADFPENSVCRLAAQSGTDYSTAAAFLVENGQIAPDDGRLSPAVMDPTAPVCMTRRAFLSQSKYFHEQIRELADQRLEISRPLKGIVGLQKKLLQAASQTSDRSGMEVASLAMTFEQSGCVIGNTPGSARLSRRLFELAARTTDRVILTDRARSFNGLVSEMATANRSTFHSGAKDLLRLGMLDPDDPRVQNSAPISTAMKSMNGDEFIRHIQSQILTGMSYIKHCDIDTFSPRSIKEDANRLPYGDHPSSQLELDKRDRDIMLGVSRLGERLAMNLHHSKNQMVGSHIESTLSTVKSCVQRSNVYANRVDKSHERAVADEEMPARKTNQIEH